MKAHEIRELVFTPTPTHVCRLCGVEYDPSCTDHWHVLEGHIIRDYVPMQIESPQEAA